MEYTQLVLLLMLIDLSGGNVILHFVGDISFDGAPSYYHRHEHCSYNDSFANVAAVLKQADLVIGNLENSFIREDMRKDALNDFVPLLSAEPKTVEALK
ncbi:uncharacterized protein LOC114574958 [Exaiptasia diaphana]|uniref:Capsule synthesis protein CapA domain-containing protein n=1 Tax=Exaiptasia diaphana TaxID=2652724 RepID=A0A913YHT4_EXADI|nr:uncharacterized protein LOC114574958 [Exaiptasia diaphana]